MDKRIVVIGTSSSGKTTFACKLSKKLNVPHIELDAIHWKPGWVSTPTEEFRSLTQQAVSSEEWIVDGNYSAVHDIVWKRATTLIWLNYSFHIVAFRAIKRTLRRVITREPMWAGNIETFRKSFLTRDSILLWVVKTHRKNRKKFPSRFIQPEYNHLSIKILYSPKEAKDFLDAFGKD